MSDAEFVFTVRRVENMGSPSRLVAYGAVTYDFLGSKISSGEMGVPVTEADVGPGSWPPKPGDQIPVTVHFTRLNRLTAS